MAAIGDFLGTLLGSRLSTGVDRAREERAQEIMNQLLQSRGMSVPQEPTPDTGILSKVGHAIDPASAGHWLANLGPVPQGIISPDQALSSIAGTGIDNTQLAAMAQQISDIKNRSAFNAASSMYEKSAGLPAGTIQGAGPQGLAALRGAMPRGGAGSKIRVFPITDQRTGLTTLNAVNLDALDLNSLATGEAVPIPKSTGVNRNAPPSSSTNVDIDPVTGKVSGIGTTIGGIQDAANAGERFRTISIEKHGERLRDMDVTLSGILYDADRLAKAYEKGGPGGLPGVIATAFDTALNSGQRLLKMSGVNIPALDAVEKDPRSKELIGLASLKGRQRVAAYNLAIGIAGLQDRSASGLSAKELAQIMDTLAPVFGGSPEVAMGTLREVVQGAAQKRNILAKSLGVGPYEAYDDQQYLMNNPGTEATPDATVLPQATDEDINKAKKRERYNKTTGAWEQF
jgi:hypothetical protein